MVGWVDRFLIALDFCCYFSILDKSMVWNIIFCYKMTIAGGSDSLGGTKDISSFGSGYQPWVDVTVGILVKCFVNS